MKNRLQVLLAAVLALSAAHLSAGTPTNLTFLSPRSDGMNIALGKAAVWNAMTDRKDKEAFGGNLQSTFFMTGSVAEDALAKYFLVGGKTSITLPRDEAANTIGSTADGDLAYLIHKINAAESTDTKLALAPEHKEIGALFSYHQDLKWLLKGLSLNLSVPLVNVQNSMNPKVTGAEAADLVKFLQGTRDESTGAVGTANAFKNLANAKMVSCTRSQTGVADVELMLGYKFFHNHIFNAAFNLGVTIPTGNVPDGEFAFDAVVGNNGHVGFGFGVDADAKLWKSECRKHCLKLMFAANYRYLFENDETRTLGFKNTNNGQYAMLINLQQPPNAQPLIPAANVTTLRCDVTPGNQFDGMLALNFGCCNWAFDLGYNLYYRDAEKVCVSSTGCGSSSPQFVDNQWAVATRNADMSLANQVNTADVTAGNPMTVANSDDFVLKPINNVDLDPVSAQTPSLLSHKVFGGVGYWTKGWEVPMLVGVGAHYEFAGADIISNWGFNARVGIGF